MSVSKLPAIQFYPADWQNSADVQAMSFHDRGVWIEILFRMHQSNERGRLLLADEAMSDEVLAKLLGLSVKRLKKSLETFLKFGVAFRDESGALCNRRMLRDEHIRRVRAEAGKLGGNPNLRNQTDNQTAKQKPTPSSSSSTSLSTSDKRPPAAPGSTPDDTEPVERRIWRDGVEILTRAGVSERDGRSLLGRWAKEHGRSELAQAIAATQAVNSPDPKAYIGGVLKSLRKDRAAMYVGLSDESSDSSEDQPKSSVARCSECLGRGRVIRSAKDGEQGVDGLVLEDCSRCGPDISTPTARAGGAQVRAYAN